MKKIIFIVEKTSTGYSAFAKSEKYPVTTTGNTLEELKSNMVDAANSYLEVIGQPLIDTNGIAVKIDLPQFFDYYKEINAKNLGSRIGMNATLLSQYVNGKKVPSEKQTQKILKGIRQLGKELASLELA